MELELEALQVLGTGAQELLLLGRVVVGNQVLESLGHRSHALGAAVPLKLRELDDGETLLRLQPVNHHPDVGVRLGDAAPQG